MRIHLSEVSTTCTLTGFHCVSYKAMLCVKATPSFPWRRREGATMTTSSAMIVTGLAACKCLQYTTPLRLRSPVPATG